MPTEKTSLPIDMPMSYFHEGEGANLLVLHGYSDNAFAARRRMLGSTLPPGYRVLAPNGPFPCPNWRGEKYHEGYAWYFRDSETGTYMIKPEVGARALIDLIAKLGVPKKPWVVLGFSQGGFFAPQLVRAGLNVRTLIAVGSGFRKEYFEGLPKFKVRAIHGDADDIVPLDKARESFDTLQPLGFGEDFHIMPGVAHRMDETGREVVRNWLAEELAAL